MAGAIALLSAVPAAATGPECADVAVSTWSAPAAPARCDHYVTGSGVHQPLPGLGLRHAGHPGDRHRWRRHLDRSLSRRPWHDPLGHCSAPFVAAIAYVDPGNIAANFSAGSQFGFLLVWVIVAANIMAGLVQYLSAKLGLVSGLTAGGGADRTRSSTRIAYWLQAELVAVATDIAEIIGGAIALRLLFDLPLVLGGIITELCHWCC